MKISQEDQQFTPINLVIESQAELDYLFALSQTSVRSAIDNARQLGYDLSNEAQLVQMPFYYAMKGVKYS